jgi:hypothetical protein
VKIEKEIVLLFIPPIIAIVLCTISSLVLPDSRNFSLDQPEYLAYVDQLSIFTINEQKDNPLDKIKDVFRHEWTGHMQGLDGYAGIQNTTGEKPAQPSVTMIVGSGRAGYCIINGKKMRIGDKTDSFKLTSIKSHSVTVSYKNGTRETYNVKLY